MERIAKKQESADIDAETTTSTHFVAPALSLWSFVHIVKALFTAGFTALSPSSMC